MEFSKLVKRLIFPHSYDSKAYLKYLRRGLIGEHTVIYSAMSQILVKMSGDKNES